MLALLGTLAAASECRWPGEVDAVSARMTSVSIDGETIRVTGRPAWSALQADLRACDWDRAAQALERWRANRRATNWTAGTSLLVWFPIVATPFTATAAGRWRETLVSEILRESEAPE